jgi:hypothetical protein
MKKQVYLKSNKEALQIPYPVNFPEAEKSLDPDDREIHLNSSPRWLTPSEIEVVEAYLQTLPYAQSLLLTGAVAIDESDPLLTLTLEQLDEMEAEESLPSTKYSIGGGIRQLNERVLIIRESGYSGVGRKQLVAGV